MELRSARWPRALLAPLLALVVWPMIATGVFGAPLFGDPLYPLVVFGSPIAGFFLPTRVVARTDGTQIWIGRKSARVADLIGVKTQTIWVNFIPTSRHMIFSFRAQESDGFFARATGVRKLALNLNNVTGGRKAAEAFVSAFGTASANPGAIAAPEPSQRPVREAEPGAQDAGFDADAIMARYLAGRRESLTGVSAAPARPGFGRKGL